MTISNVSHTNKFLGDLKGEYDEKVNEFNAIIESLQEEIRLIKLSRDRIDDL